jgi:hypothetical protein
MLRIPNPGSDLDVFVRIFRDLHRDLKGQYSFNMDAITKAMVARSNVSSQGAFGDEALRRSTKADRSRDQLYNQSKMYAELYRTLGWFHSTTAKLLFSFSALGDHVGEASNPNPLFCECLLGMAYPNEVLGVKSTQHVRVFSAILKTMQALDGRISRDEIIAGPMAVDDDRRPEKIERMISTLRQCRAKSGSLAILVDRVGQERGITKTTMENYTRFPIAAIQWAGWAVKQQGFFHMTSDGREELKRIETLVDFRLGDFRSMPEETRAPFIRACFYRMLERANFDLSPVSAQLQSDERVLRREKAPEPREVLFSPFQQIEYTEVNAALPRSDSDSGAAAETKRSKLEERGAGPARRRAMTVLYQTISAPVAANTETEALRAEVGEALRKNKGKVSPTIEALIAKYAEANQDEFYPLVARLFQLLGFDCQLSRRGRNYERADATIVADDGSVPVEIKSPGEEMEISVKGVRQALENKVVLLARKRFPVKRGDTSLVVGYEPPNDRSEVHELIDDIDKAFSLRVGVVDFRSLLTLVVEVVASGKQVQLTSFKQLKGVIRVERSSPA